MRTAILIRTGSISPRTDISLLSPRSQANGHDAGVSCYRRNKIDRMSFDVRERRDLSSPAGKPKPLRRIRSDTDLIRSAPRSAVGARLSRPAMLAEVEKDDLVAGAWKGVSADLAVKEDDEIEYSGGAGKGKGTKSVGGGGGVGGTGDSNRDRRIGNYYQEMLRSDPGNPLLLGNYGRFLQEVERDLTKAEEYYGRAILASPSDGELLSLYARLIWESQRDCKRTEVYHERAVEASPDDCYVLGSYAHFLWDAEGEEEGRVASTSPFVEAF